MDHTSPVKEECKVEGCDEPQSSDKHAAKLGVCEKHYVQVVRFAEVLKKHNYKGRF